MEEITTKRTLVKVTNRNNGTTGYTLNNGFRRQFSVGQTRDIDLNELRELMGIDGGEYILQHFLIIDDQTALDYLNLKTEPEYFYTRKDIEKLLSDGSLDELEDCLNFAPDGVIELIKSIAIETELPDVRKRDLIFKITGFNISNALMVNKFLEGEDKTPKAETKVRKVTQKTETKVRKVTPVETEKQPTYTRINKV